MLFLPCIAYGHLNFFFPPTGFLLYRLKISACRLGVCFQDDVPLMYRSLTPLSSVVLGISLSLTCVYMYIWYIYISIYLSKGFRSRALIPVALPRTLRAEDTSSLLCNRWVSYCDCLGCVLKFPPGWKGGGKLKCNRQEGQLFEVAPYTLHKETPRVFA